jgi:hypothetical protein
MQNRTPSNFLRISSGLLALVMTLSACIPFQIPGLATAEEKNASTITPSEVDKSNFAEVIFQVQIPEGQTKTAIFLDVLDETTGLALRPVRYTMEEQNSDTYITKIPFKIGSVIKYRYRKDGNPPAVEMNNLNQVVRYRQYIVVGPSSTTDLVFAWSDTPESSIKPFGRIDGIVKDAQTGSPVGNMLVTAAGQQTLSAPDGTFLFEGVQAGTHLIVAQHVNGDYAAFQQGAKVEINATTPAVLAVEARKKVNVTFITSVPSGGITGLPVRMIGSTFNLGNTFSDLQGGTSVIASRAPLMQAQEDGRYQLTLQMPAGAYVEYKYTLGDGYWNAEQSSSGASYTRNLIVPNQDTTIEDTISAWGAADGSTITFKVSAPEFTPATDTISIQFNAFGWSSPIPMWPLGGNQWIYILNGPEQMLQYLKQYRYCRNDQCETGVETDSTGAIIAGRSLPALPVEQPIQDLIAGWYAYFSSETATTVPEIEINPRPSGFVTGIEIMDQYSPFSQAYLGAPLRTIKDLNANWLVISPSQMMMEIGNPIFKNLPGDQITPLEIAQLAGWAEAKLFNIALFPKVEFVESYEAFWQQDEIDSIWWSVAFERYEKYLLSQADLARMVNAEEMIIGDPSIAPMMASGTLPDGSDPEIPFDVNQWWNNLVDNLRTRFEGKIYLAIDPSSTVKPSQELLDKVDGVYALYNPTLAAESLQPTETADAINTEIEGKLMGYHTEGKPFILAIAYPFGQSSQIASGQSLENQVLVYNSILLAVNNKDWISGVVSRGFEPGLMTKFNSASIYGKPASNALWYWFPRLLGLQ